jgi:hypothetical protein
MKPSALIALCALIPAFALLAACNPDNVAETDSCMECHSGYTGADTDVLARTAQYEESGHFQGPRTLVESTLDTGHLYVFHGSNAMYCNGASGPTNCTKCHTHQGFVDYVETGSPLPFYGAASPPGCFTCHKPHVSGNFNLRKETSETLVTGTTTFNWGKGNLCVTCHKALIDATTFLPDETGGIYPKDWTNRDGMHHGPQADFMMGTNHRPFPSKTYAGTSVHLNGNLPNSCVSCHLYEPGARLGGTLELGGHGMYLTGDVHGTNSNVIGACRNCHTYSGSSLVSAATTSMTGGFEGSTSSVPPIVANVNASLDDIRALRDLLIVYFGTDANWPAAGRRITAVSGGDVSSPTPGEWERDWVFTSSISSSNFSLSEDESFAYWNFMLFTEDKSQGIHNPPFAYQILYDSAEALGINVSAFTRP